MNLHLSELTGRQWVLALFLLGLVVVAEAFLCAGIGLVAARIKGPARLVLWPVFLVLIVALLPGFLTAAMFFGFMRPPYGGHLSPPDQQSWPQRGVNGLIEMIGGRSASAEPTV